ncbi:hypothetical protein C9374_001134 [Naegleria lovaniensis]|uniref:DUF4832 domain-containing protein n=1 Tax=Naegleria lovaniensis TaxID=51637 RepID=A0AA88GV88_NAELO|nr:uncharacterized protein C9374_001134 [Naegleria lovaniensis]KAG2387540.1 hypothetical protein C9374_001134 [Naegleria lovaniensis]
MITDLSTHLLIITLCVLLLGWNPYGNNFILLANGKSSSSCVNILSKPFIPDLTPTLRNPLRGFASYEDTYETFTFPQSLEYRYFPLNVLMNSMNNFTFSNTQNNNRDNLEKYLNDVKKRKRQAILRVYLDYPNCCPDGTYNTGVPSFLFQGQNAVTLTPYTEYGGGQSPDYSNERLVSALEAFIQKLGQHYDGDTRIAYIQVGLLGYWGEWHTYPNTNQMAPLSTRWRVLTAFYNAFNVTKILVSQDSMQYFCPPLGNVAFPSIGFHDDAFTDATYSGTTPQDYYFYNRLQSRIPDLNKFLTQNSTNAKVGAVIGGELYPSNQAKIFKSGWTGQNFKIVFRERIKTSVDEYQRALNASVLLGYAFTVNDISLCNATSTSMNLKLNLQNIGSAPFPYPNITLLVSLRNGTLTSDTILSTQSVNIIGVTPSTGVQTFSLNFQWSSSYGVKYSPQVLLRLQSKHVPSEIPIAFAVKGAPTDGSPFVALEDRVQVSNQDTQPEVSKSSTQPNTSPKVSTKTSPKTSRGVNNGQASLAVSDRKQQGPLATFVCVVMLLLLFF